MRNSNKKISQEVKGAVLAEAEAPGCVISEVAARYGISGATIYNWRSQQERIMATKLTPKACKFVELEVESRVAPSSAILEKASLQVGGISITIEGKLRSAGLVALIKTLEEVC
jgi:transposase-like protein